MIDVPSLCDACLLTVKDLLALDTDQADHRASRWVCSHKPALVFNNCTMCQHAEHEGKRCNMCWCDSTNARPLPSPMPGQANYVMDIKGNVFPVWS